MQNYMEIVQLLAMSHGYTDPSIELVYFLNFLTYASIYGNSLPLYCQAMTTFSKGKQRSKAIHMTGH